MVSTYEYWGSVVDMFLDCSGMVEDLGEFMITGIGCMVVTASRGSEREMNDAVTGGVCVSVRNRVGGCHCKLE